MPFTVSHAAAVLPFRRTRLPWAALVIGSFGPDFAYFLENRGEARAWHYYPDLVFLCFPFTVLAFYVFHALLKRPMVSLLPRSLQRRISFEKDPYPHSATGVVSLFVALWIGILTHKVWDAFTHALSWPWYHMPALREVVFYNGRDPVLGFEVAQAASTVFGLAIVGLYIARWYRRTPEHEVREPFSSGVRWAIVAGMVVLALVLAMLLTRARYPRLYVLNDTFELFFVVSSIAWWMWAAVAYSVVMWVREQRVS